MPKISTSSWRVAVSLALLIGFSLVATEAHAQKLSIQGDRFAVDGEPRFLTFISMFGVMAAPNINADLHTIKTLGFDGFRIWPNIDTGPQIFNADGTVRPAELERLRSILDQARRERLIVDVSFTFEHTPGLTAGRVRQGILAVTDALRTYDNVLFDIQNERNVGDRRFMSEADVQSIFAGIKSVDPARITTASNSPVDTPEYAADFAGRLGLDVTAYHEPRMSRWYWLSSMETVVRAMKSTGRPAYLQESMPTRDNLFPYPAHDRAEYFMQGIAHAKLSGAAAWCFHTDVGTDYRDGGPALLEDRLRSFPEPEWAFVNSLNARVILRASNGVNFLVAESGGGAGVRADRTAAGPGSWDVFGASALAGGPLIAGERIALSAANGNYLMAVGGGGATLRATAQSAGSWESFRIEKPGGGVIRHGDAIALRANDTPWYVTAESGGGGNVMVNAAARAAWETFTVLFVSPHSTDPQALRIDNRPQP